MLPCCAVSLDNRVRKGVETGFLEKESPVARIAKKLQYAEFFQLFFFGSQAVLYALALNGYFPLIIAGTTTFALIPLQAIAYYRSMILYGTRSRFALTVICCALLAATAILSICKFPGDYALTMCGGGFIVHVLRLISERCENQDKKRDIEPYQAKREHIPFLCASIVDRIRKAQHAHFIQCSDADLPKVAKKIQAAEFFQIFYFLALTVLFALTQARVITPLQAGICTLAPLPLQAWASHQTKTLYGPKSRLWLNVALLISLIATGVFSILGMPGHYTWMFCFGNLLFHTIRLLAERSDYQKSVKALI